MIELENKTSLEKFFDRNKLSPPQPQQKIKFELFNISTHLQSDTRYDV